MKKKITISLITNVLIVATFFGFKSWDYKSKIDKLEEIGASFGYGMTDVLHVDLSNTEVNDEDLSLLDIFSLEKIDLTNTKITNLEPLHKQQFLLSLVLNGTEVPQEQIDLLKKKLPSLKIKKEKKGTDQLR